jgi:hypothetical protein
MTLTPQVVLKRLRQAAQRPGGFILSIHAFSRSGHRSVPRRDIVHAFLTAATATLQDNGTWRISSTDEEGDELTVIVSVRDTGTLEVITVY